MRNIIRRFILLVAVLCVSGTYVSADNEYTIEKNFSDGYVTVSGDSTTATVAVMVVPSGQDPKKVWENSEKSQFSVSVKNSTDIFNGEYSVPEGLEYINIIKTENGKFNDRFKLNNSGDFVVAVFADGSEKESEPFRFTAQTQYNQIVDDLNGYLDSKDKTGFVSLLSDETIKNIGWDSALNSSIDMDLTKEILYNSMSGKHFEPDKYKENVLIFEGCAVAQALNQGVISNATQYLKNVAKDDELLLGYFDKFINSEEKEKYLTKKLYNKSITTITQSNADTVNLLDELKKAMLITVVKYNDGYLNIEKAFNDFNDILGMSTVTTNRDVWKWLAGQDINSIEELLSKYNNPPVPQNPPQSGGGGSSSGGGISLDIKSTSSNPQELLIDIFEDISAVPWAREAIVELAERGVVAGRDKTHFCPTDKITREEFTKLIAEAFLREEPESALSFDDVSPEKWYYKYIAKAKSAGIIGGYSESKFGVGDNITRNDMAVIIYNAARYKGLELPQIDENIQKFADDAEITDYAKNAVYSLVDMGIVSGVGDMRFAPGMNATRAEATVIIYRLLLK